MTDQIEGTFPILRIPICNYKCSLAELSTPSSGKLKEIKAFPLDDFEDEFSTMDSVNLFSQNIETPVKSLHKRSYSDDMALGFDSIYEKIESFLDKEGLHVISPSPILTCKTLKPCLRMSELSKINMSQSAKLSGSNNKAITSMNPCFSLKTALPMFMVKRTVSTDSVNNVNNAKNLLLSETKFSFKRFSECSKDSALESPLNVKKNTYEKSR